MSEVREWLQAIGLPQYADAFEANDIDMDLLRQVDDQMLKDFGVASGGHRLRIRNAIARLGAPPTPDPGATATASAREPAASSAERRQLTVMFCDLVGSTTLSTKLDPEDLRAVIGAYHRCATEFIERNGGFVAKYMGDGVLAYFGYPRADEHDAERAARAGLVLVEAVPKLVTIAGSPLQVRVGVATGLVVVGDLIGTGAAQEQAVVGETPNLAARLQALAEPGSVVVSGITRQLIGGLFEYHALGPVMLKGFAEGTPAWRVVGASAAESRFEALRASTTPLVGRDEEIDLLLRRWQQAKGGDGQVVLICGEPGIGKSRIAQTLMERLGAEPYIRLRYFCSPHHQDSALYPSIAQLERVAGFRREDTSEERLNKLEAVLARGTNEVRDIAPLFAELLSIPTGDRYPPVNLTPQKRKEKTIQAQLAQVDGLSGREPVLMLYEDLHWSDPTTRESLDLLVDRVSSLRVLVIITFRPEFAPPWIGRPHVTMLSLNRLPPRQRAAMIAEITGGKSLPKEITDQIIARTDGVPLFVEELTKSVLESGIVKDAGDHYAAVGAAAQVAIPTSLHASLLARLDRLAPTREIAQIGAALGRSFSHELISEVAQMPRDQVDQALAQLVRAELIFRRGTPPDAEYTFKHALVQDAAYSTLLRARRQQLHARIAATLEQRFNAFAIAQPAVMAQHYTEAGLPERALGYWLKAGQQAVARSAMAEAVAQLRKGLELLANVPESPLRSEQELNLLTALGPALIATKGYSASEVGETIVAARALAERLNRSEYLAQLLYGQWGFHFVRGEHRQALLDAQQVRRLGEERNIKTVLELGQFYQAIVHFQLGEFLAAFELMEQCRTLADHAQSVVQGAEDGRMGIRAWRGITLTYLGHLDQGRAQMDKSRSVARDLQLSYTVAMALTFSGWFAYSTGSSDEVRRYSDEGVALSSEQGFPVWLALGLSQNGWALAMQGRQLEGLEFATKGLGLMRAIGCVCTSPWVLAELASIHIKLGRIGEALEVLAEAQQIIEATEERRDESGVHRLRGDGLAAAGDQLSAENSYQRALAVARHQSAKVYELQAATSCARLWREQGRRAEAHDVLAPVYGWFTEGFDTPVLKEARALLEQLSV
jgi:class 3 adenylate cyclase/tetratricopeptide (TPR) repeat protein